MSEAIAMTCAKRSNAKRAKRLSIVGVSFGVASLLYGLQVLLFGSNVNALAVVWQTAYPFVGGAVEVLRRYFQ